MLCLILCLFLEAYGARQPTLRSPGQAGGEYAYGGGGYGTPNATQVNLKLNFDVIVFCYLILNIKLEEISVLFSNICG